MQSLAPSLRLDERPAAAFRLLALALAALAVVLGGQQAEPRLLLLGVGYATITALLWLLAPRLAHPWSVYPIAIVDVGVVTALLILSTGPAPALEVLSPPTWPLPLWVLYLFPFARAAAGGWKPVALAGSLSVAGYLSALGLAGGIPPGPAAGLALWPVPALVATAFVVAVLATRWHDERREKRAWQEVLVAARALGGNGEQAEVAALVVERTRRLARGDQAWLWWCDAPGQLRPGPYVGPESERTVPGDTMAVSPATLAKLERGPAPLAELGEPFARCKGDVIALASGGNRVALLTVVWDETPPDRMALRQRLRVFASFAADALASARDRAATMEELRREGVLRRAAMELAATSDRQTVQDVVVAAARSGLGIAIASVEELAPLGRSDDQRLHQLATAARTALERCAAHERLQAEVSRLRAYLEAAPAPLAVWDAEGRLVLANAAYQGLALDRTAPRPFTLSGPLEEEIVVGNPPRTFVALTTPAIDQQYAVVLYREITREREALRAKDDLIAKVGHELRNPLTSIHGYSQMMARQLGVVQQQVGQLNQLIADLLDAARLESGQLPLKRQPVDLAALAREAADRFHGAYEGYRLRLEFSDVPPVEGDPARLGQVLDNLLGNAAKYSSPDQPIVLAIGRREDDVVISVEDRGAGIEPEHLPHLFERFYRVPGARTEQTHGFGLGLSIVRDLVVAHGGRVWAESAGPGQGSTFHVSLPIASGTSTLQSETVGNGVLPGHSESSG